MENLLNMFLAFIPSVGVKHFWVDLDGRHVFAPTPSVGVVYIWGGVYVILILRDKTLTRYQQSLTKLNAMQAT